MFKKYKYTLLLLAILLAKAATTMIEKDWWSIG
ncbi:quorum-sensing system DWW-type pheromone [Streptococcus bovimastitidis]|nr:quorum-sensing system DWW-type pheromone [Streptococcus bovimastitidis]